MKSILFSLWMTCLRLDWRDALADIWRAARAIVRALRASRVKANAERSILRSSHCRLCPFYNSKWRTCGTAGEVIERIPATQRTPYFAPRKIGCWCYLPLANLDPAKDCYARANHLDLGWPDVLRPRASGG